MSAHLYIEGGSSKMDKSRCREGFRKLLEASGLRGRMPRLVACGGRSAVFDDFQTAHRQGGAAGFVAMLVDSEEPLADVERTWDHLRKRDSWSRPAGAEDEQVLFMTTSMETWIVADREALRRHYGGRLQENALPPVQGLEQRSREEVYECLTWATRTCPNTYAKGRRSYEVLRALDPSALSGLPSFTRMLRILETRL